MRADGLDRPSSGYGCITRDLEMNSRMLEVARGSQSEVCVHSRELVHLYTSERLPGVEDIARGCAMQDEKP